MVSIDIKLLSIDECNFATYILMFAKRIRGQMAPYSFIVIGLVYSNRIGITIRITTNCSAIAYVAQKQ